MPLNKQKGDMYEFCTHTWNPIKGKCKFDCAYCFMKSIIKEPKPIRLVGSELKTNLGRNNFIFVGSSTDMFHPDVSGDWIEEVLVHCREYPENTYLFQSKNPFRFFQFIDKPDILPLKTILGTTIETNRDTTTEISKAPSTYFRKVDMFSLRKAGCKIMITIEPILEFDLDIMIQWMKEIDPLWVNIGADSKNHNLPEPSWDKVEQLILELEKFTKVVIKNNLGRLKK